METTNTKVNTIWQGTIEAANASTITSAHITGDRDRDLSYTSTYCNHEYRLLEKPTISNDRYTFYCTHCLEMVTKTLTIVKHH